jgi:tripartite ATP-independent transporter DctP family solute receptor
MKKHIFTSVIVALTFVLAVMGNASAADKWNIKFGHDQPETSAHHEGALHFKKLVEEGSNGEIAIKVFPMQVLGTSIHMSEMVQTGALEIMAVPTTSVQVLQPSLQVLDLPFLFITEESVYGLLDGPLGDALYKPLLSKNFVGLSWLYSGFKQFTSSFPVYRPEDFQGRKIRVMPAPIVREQFKAFGASPVPIDFSELYNALQQRVVDGQENPLHTIVSMKFYEVQKYMTLSNHALLGHVFVASKAFYDSLPPKYQGLVREAARKTSVYERNLIPKNEERFLEIIKKAGVNVIELKPEEKQAFQKAVEPVYDWFNKNVSGGKEYYDMIRAAEKK